MAEGFKMASVEIVVQLDSDSYIDPYTFRNIIAPFQNKEIAAVCAHADPQNADKNFITKMQAAYYFMSFRVLKAAESTFMSVFCCSGCSSAYRKSMVMPIIGQWLNEKFLGLPVTWGDDRALTSWLLKEGHKTIYTDQVQAYTIVPEKFKQLLKQQLRWKKSWIINSIFTSKFIWKKQPFVAFLYYFPLVIVSFLTPIMTFRALFYLPVIKSVAPFYHIFGVMLITALLAVCCRIFSKKESHWPYLFLWSLFNLFILSFVMFWAVIKIQDRGWGTR
jgi:hyaluronan synthase